MRIMLKDFYRPFVLNLCGFEMTHELLMLDDITEDEFWGSFESVHVGRIGNA